MENQLQRNKKEVEKYQTALALLSSQYENHIMTIKFALSVTTIIVELMREMKSTSETSNDLIQEIVAITEIRKGAIRTLSRFESGMTFPFENGKLNTNNFFEFCDRLEVGTSDN